MNSEHESDDEEQSANRKRIKTDRMFTVLMFQAERLGKEVENSIRQQNNVLIGGYGSTVVFLGYVFARDPIPTQLLIVVPVAFLFMISLWLNEANRMVRAGYFMGYELVPELFKLANVDSGTHPPNWEIWIRDLDSATQRGFSRRQNFFQLFAVVAIPICASLFCLYASFSFFQAFGPTVYYFIVAFLAVWWVFILLNIGKVTNLSAVRRAPSSQDN